MAETRLALELETEVKEILEHIENGDNFLLSGGAGSGKTYSLVQLIGELIRIHPFANIACITYTNSAVQEIEERISSERLRVSTIHDFLWDAISPYQKELRSTLFELISGDEPKIKSGNLEVVEGLFDKQKIKYKDYRILREGIISHDEVIILSEAIFAKYPKISDITRDRFTYIFVDEYQDTDPHVITILLKHLQQSKRKGVCGFFGDEMQAIYDGSIGTIRNYINEGLVKEVQKRQNRRNPRLVYELANKLRLDGLIQEASNDSSAPNMTNGQVKDGEVRFYYSMGHDKKLQELREKLGWDFTESSKTKELNLTHALISQEAGFNDLWSIYTQDGVLNFRDRIKKYIKDNDDITKYVDLTFGEVITNLQENVQSTAVKPTRGMQKFIDENPELFESAKKINFHDLCQLYVSKEQLIDDNQSSEGEVNSSSQQCDFIKHVFKILALVDLYTENKYNELVRKTNFRITSVRDIQKLRESIESIFQMSELPIEKAIDAAHDKGFCIKDDNYNDFKNSKEYLYNRLINIKYESYRKLYDYLKGRTSFSTQHKIKGQEFQQVLVILDNGRWSHYNFNYLFTESGTKSVRLRTQKLFYVCCTRAKEKLVVYFHEPSPVAIDKAKQWFGLNNVIKI